MIRLSEPQLICARALGDWTALWLAADPLVKFAMSKLGCGDEDALQQGRLAAGLAIRSWAPEKGAFSTHITTQVIGAIRDWLRAAHNGGVGSRRQRADDQAVELISLDAPAEVNVSHDLGEDQGGETHLERLTYDDLDDFDSINTVMLKLDTRGQLNTALDRLPPDDSKFLREVMRAGGVTAFSRLTGMRWQTTSRTLARIVQKLVRGQRRTCYNHHTGSKFLPGGEDFGAYRWQRAMLGPSIKVESSIHSTGCPWADWSWKPTRADVRNGAAPRSVGYPWSAGARRLLGKKAKK
jgi:RNA polymerase sigma factor (sigma-70 family)